jgi:hypothetical protein
LEKILKEAVMAQSIYYPGICLEGLRNHENLRIGGVLAET